MSFKITRAAIHNKNVYGLHKLVLIILADHEGNEYGSWPSMARIADMAGISVRHAQRVLRDLEEANEIVTKRQWASVCRNTLPRLSPHHDRAIIRKR